MYSGENVLEFNARKVKDDIVAWIREWFEKNGNDCVAVVGISGGKDSSVVAALCVEALGKDRVFGVLMPKGEQHDIDVALSLVNHLNIRHTIINIKSAYDAIVGEIKNNIELTNQAIVNLPPRLRMSTLYAVSQSLNGRVANTCNLSEDWVGYSTRYGDSVGDFSPLSNFTVTEVKEIGRVLGLPSIFVDKVPIDGLSGKTDEDNLGFTYDVLDKYIRTGICEDDETKKKIDTLHIKNKFKLQLMPIFSYNCD
ncbi:MAG: NAD(+) synthase [Clostridia bacterium]|nr:NAD(+) synthase [Clostridia bacterium]